MMLIGRIVAGFAVGLLSMSGESRSCSACFKDTADSTTDADKSLSTNPNALIPRYAVSSSA